MGWVRPVHGLGPRAWGNGGSSMKFPDFVHSPTQALEEVPLNRTQGDHGVTPDLPVGYPPRVHFSILKLKIH